MQALTDTKCRQAKPTEKPYQLQDGGGLYLEIRPTGKKVWRYRYWLTPTKDGRLTIGDYPGVSLQEARKAMETARALVREGKDPNIRKRVVRLESSIVQADTFEVIAREWIEKKRAGWGERYLEETTAVLEKNIFPHLGDVPISEVTPAALLAVLRKMEARGAATYATIARSRCSAVFRYSVQTLRCESDPAALLAGAIVRNPRETARPMPRDVIADLKAKLSVYPGFRTTILAFRLIMLTWVRTIELRRAEWVDFDLDGAMWVIPPEKMKMKRMHLVPLSIQSVACLRELHPLTGGGRLLFPHSIKPDEKMSVDTLNSAFVSMGYARGEWSAHDFRATASTHLHELGFDTDHIEVQLAHSDSKSTRGVYNHAKYLPQRKVMMQAWADWLDKV